MYETEGSFDGMLRLCGRDGRHYRSSGPEPPSPAHRPNQHGDLRRGAVSAKYLKTEMRPSEESGKPGTTAEDRRVSASWTDIAQHRLHGVEWRETDWTPVILLWFPMAITVSRLPAHTLRPKNTRHDGGDAGSGT
ncbi:hypothetical protein QTP88_024162 [Uroleucon formosanum]